MSRIEWTGETWNAIVGCSVVSPGCTNCYAMRMASRLEAMAGDGLDDNGYAVRGKGPLDHYRGLTRPSRAGPVWTGKVAFSEDALLKPLKRRKPTTYFVNSMSDLFHEDVPDEWIDRVFAVMALTPQHTYQVLTKRSARMMDYMRSIWTVAPAPGYPRADGEKVMRRVYEEAGDMAVSLGLTDVVLIAPNVPSRFAPPGRRVFLDTWPLPNVWLGVSAEDQRRADERIPDLLATPAAVRFISAEPLLGPIDFNRDGIMYCFHRYAWGDTVSKINWIIVGGESGPGAREFKLGWARDIVQQCQMAGVAVFVKQIGARPTDCHDGVELPVTTYDRKGGDMAEWPPELCIRQMPGRTDNYIGDLVL